MDAAPPSPSPMCTETRRHTNTHEERTRLHRSSGEVTASGAARHGASARPQRTMRRSLRRSTCTKARATMGSCPRLSPLVASSRVCTPAIVSLQVWRRGVMRRGWVTVVRCRVRPRRTLPRVMRRGAAWCCNVAATVCACVLRVVIAMRLLAVRSVPASSSLLPWHCRR